MTTATHTRPATTNEPESKDGFERQGRKVLFLDMIAAVAEDLTQPEGSDLNLSARRWLEARGYAADHFTFDFTCDLMNMTAHHREAMHDALIARPTEIVERFRALDRDQNFEHFSNVVSGHYDYNETVSGHPHYIGRVKRVFREVGDRSGMHAGDDETLEESEGSSMGMNA